ncbi:MAG: glycosyltransferase, partial [Muribaculaceae bacterium]|nr:glycosyltransferase [Muribaculaceae bacterium]
MHESDDKVTVSVVIPVYNSGKYLSAAIESVLGQSFSDLELILVNDGSTDNSGEVIRRYEAADRRVRPVTTRN